MKHVVAILVIIGYGFVGIIATVIAAISRDASFYVPFVPIVTVGFIVVTILAIYQQMRKKPAKIVGIVFFLVAVVSVVSYEGYQAYLKRLEIVSTQDFDLSAYRPFTENTKAVKLDEESTYKIEDNLPKLDGATALYPVYSGFVQAVYPIKEYPLQESEVVSTQTDTSFHRLVNGDVDMTFMAHPSKAQMRSAERHDLELTLTPIGREAFVFFVHANNPVSSLTTEQIQKIYSGDITNWQEVGGKDEEIRAFQRPDGSGSQTALVNVMDGKALMDPPSEEIVSGMGGIIRETSNYKNRSNAIGFSFRHFSNEMVKNGKIKHIAIDGFEPTKENIQNESYPFVDQFFAITAGSNNPHVDPFLDWMQSEQGQEIVNLTGYVPVK
ncbi:PstS family phosphate ABC transporter substrate-binding protein [Aquibacillus sediminis]|uniref:PstS family phosphate ABC transporter substrate-binding protein n=1 Tax=Aquibacillus sediminis TaxID=2574734 RepID=UPI00110832DC|nr:substrate-binding domain-containing protein [Aquibacillus sediminis]